MKTQKIKKAVRGLYYGLFAVLGAAMVWFIVDTVTRTWDRAWELYVGIALAAIGAVLVKIGMWAFYEPKPLKSESDFPTPERKRDANGKFIYE